MYTQNVTTDKEREMRKKDLEEQDRYVSEKHTQKQKESKLYSSIPSRVEAPQRTFQRKPGSRRALFDACGEHRWLLWCCCC